VVTAYVALGSNLGDRRAHLRSAVEGLPGVQRVSGVYETDPVGGPEQEPFLNCVVELDTNLGPHELLAECQRLEQAADRVRAVRWGPRTLDIDILLYDDLEVATPQLDIPHPRMAERRFVLQPLADLAPERCPPDWDETLPGDGVHRVADL
jgi:2-amino-4-hydroxy-6-hydroxymethyldihydropteridine diphosphokinase